MTPVARDLPTPVGQLQIDSLISTLADPRHSHQTSSSPNHDVVTGGPRSRINRAARLIRPPAVPRHNNRRQSRVAFLQPARILFFGTSLKARRATHTSIASDGDSGLDVVVTDLTLIGAGVIVSGSYEALPFRVGLSVEDVMFDCEVRWSRRIGSRVCRYGLLFRDVLNSIPSAVAVDSAVPVDVAPRVTDAGTDDGADDMTDMMTGIAAG